MLNSHPNLPTRWRRWVGGWTLGLGLYAVASGWLLGTERSGLGVAYAHDPISTKVTWAREISAILERRCVSCHRPGGYAGFPLTTYEEARPWAVAIKEEVLAGDMPPWGAAPGIGHFTNDRRPTRHEQEIIAAWVDGGAPYSPEARTPAFLNASSQSPTPVTISWDPPAGGLAIPLAPVTITEGYERTAGVTVNLPPGMIMTAWTFEPGAATNVERADFDLGSTWIGTWTPGEASIEFPADTGAPLNGSATFTARIVYRAPAAPTADRSRLRVWTSKEARPKTVREATVVRSWRAAAAVDLFALRPTAETGDVEVVARFANGRAEPLGLLHRPSHGPHPTYRLMRPLALPAGARVEATGPVRLLYSAGATRTVKPNVRRRPRR